MTELRATARLQFHREFPIDRATDLVPYFDDLGISHLYASPLLKARPGSTHGYDIVDHNEINPELGGEVALRRLVDALRARGMGLILDIVPNHMGVGGSDNAWWMDVLEWGQASPYSGFFDIDWQGSDPNLSGKVLAPFLGNSYGDALAAGDIRLSFDGDDGRFIITAYDTHRFPVALNCYAGLLRMAGGSLDTLAERFADAGPGGRDAIRKRAELGRKVLADVNRRHPERFAAIVAKFNPSKNSGCERLHDLLQRQSYRLAWWRAATDEINWRRFFDINSLAGVRVETSDVFDATHETVLRLYAEGVIDGVRVDHVDGLADPRGYCRKLRRKLDTARQARPETLRDLEPIIWVEKILFPHESLPLVWLTDGTTGYDFMNEASGLLHDPDGEAKLTEIWTRITGRPGVFDEEAKRARRQILRETLSSELNETAAQFHRILQRDLATRDWTVTAVRRCLEAVLENFHTYRIYAGITGPSDTDRRDIAWAMAGARRQIRRADRDLLELVGTIISGEMLRAAPAGIARRERLRALVRFQQLSAPTAAKSVEDTAFYRYGRLLSRNEVGSEPSQFALTPSQFHAAAETRRRDYPRALLATATHDHKRGEDTRARLAVLSEIPDEWDQCLARWTRLNSTQKRQLDGGASPDAADELMIYQTIVAAWPLDLAADDAEGIEAYRARLSTWLEKSVREAKRESDWAAPNEAYETACQDFLSACLDITRAAPIAAELAELANRIAPAGAINSLTQTLLRLTCPGVPDLYQGTEFWDFSLVDPDNRRPVDFKARQQALRTRGMPAALLEHWRDGRVKQAVIARALSLRVRKTALFAGGSYEKLPVLGEHAANILAFQRTDDENNAIVVIVPRLAANIKLTGSLCFDPAGWQETKVQLPRNHQVRRHIDAFGDTGVAAISCTDDGCIRVADALATFPVALLEAQ